MNSQQSTAKPKTATQLRRLFGLFKHKGIDREGRAQLVDQFTAGRSISCKDLTFHEAQLLIHALSSPSPSERGSGGEASSRMRRRIISMAHEMGWERAGGKIDMDRVYAWVDKYGYLHKAFNAYTVQELPKLVTQFENMYKDYLKKITNY